MNKTMIITGACGMMGSAAVHYFMNNHPEIDLYCIDDLSGGSRDNIPENANFIKLDLRNVYNLKAFFIRNFYNKKLNYILHYAAAAHEGRSYFTPIENMSRNDEAFRNLLTNAINFNVDHVVFFSSMSRYGTNKVPYTEDLTPNPEDPYAVSKVASEMLIKAFKKIYNFTYTIWVPHNCFAVNQHIDPYRNVIAIWMNLILQDKTPVIYGNGYQIRAMSWVNDFNTTICEAVFNDNVYNKILNIGGDCYLTINEWYALVQQVTGFSKPAKYLDPRPGEIPDAYCDHSLVQELLDFKNKTPILEALKTMWEYFKQIGPREFTYMSSYDIESELIPRPWKNKNFEVIDEPNTTS